MWRETLEFCQKMICENNEIDYCPVYIKDEINFWQDIAIWLFDDFYRGEQPQKILDVGCAYGTLSAYCSKLFSTTVTSIDVKKYISDQTIKFFNLDFLLMDIELVEIPDGLYDKIIFTEILEHLYYNPVPTLKKLHDKLAYNGCLYLSTPDSNSMWGKINKYYKTIEDMPYPHYKDKPDFNTIDEHIYQYNKQELEQIIEQAGFIIKKFSLTDREYRGNHFCLKLIKK